MSIVLEDYDYDDDDDDENNNNNMCQVPIQSRSRQVAVTVLLMPDAVETVTRAPDDGWRYHPRYLERFTDINKLHIFNSLFNQVDAQNLFHNKFYFMPLHVSSTCAHHQEVKIALHSLWYHHSYRWASGARDGRGLHSSPNPCTRRPPIGMMRLCNAILT